MALWRLFYHMVWATADRQPLITPAIELPLYGYMIGKANALGVITHAIGGIADHIHLVVSIPPKLAISTFAQRIKGSSAHYINHTFHLDTTFGWQHGYGIFSIGSRQLDDVIAYVQRQKEHHHQRTMIGPLELESSDDDAPACWHDGSALSGIPILANNEQP